MNGEVKYEVSGPPSQIASAKFVLNDAAREIRLGAFLYGTLFGLVLALVAIVALAVSHSSATVPDVPGGPRKEAASPGSIPGSAPSTSETLYPATSDNPKTQENQ